MTYENKKRVRDFIAQDKNWVIVDGILGENISALVWDKKVEIIYMDMDGNPCTCEALCYPPKFTHDAYFRATNGEAEGNKMCNVIAYRPLAR